MIGKGREVVFIAIAILAICSIAKASPNLLAYWSFDSACGKTWYDVTGHGFDAVGTGDSLGLANGIRGKALNCRGSNFDIAVKNSVGNFGLNRFSVEVWVCPAVDLVNPGSFYNYRSIFDNSRTGLSGSGICGGFAVENTDYGIPYVGTSNGDGSGWDIPAMSDSAMLPGKWYFLTATCDGTNLRFFVNGKLKDQAQVGGGIMPPPIQARIGCQFQVFNESGTTGATRNWFAGKIDELKLYDDALTPETVLAHYTAIQTKCTMEFGMPTLYARPGEELWAPVYLNDTDTATTLNACAMTLSFDTSVISFVTVSNLQGIWQGWQMSEIKRGENALAISLGALGRTKPGISGEIFRCQFRVKPATRIGQSSAVELGQILLNENSGLTSSTRSGGIVVTGPTGARGAALIKYSGFDLLPEQSGIFLANYSKRSGEIVVSDFRGRVVGRKAFSVADGVVRVLLTNASYGAYAVTVRSGGEVMSRQWLVR